MPLPKCGRHTAGYGHGPPPGSNPSKGGLARPGMRSSLNKIRGRTAVRVEGSFMLYNSWMSAGFALVVSLWPIGAFGDSPFCRADRWMPDCENMEHGHPRNRVEFSGRQLPPSQWCIKGPAPADAIPGSPIDLDQFGTGHGPKGWSCAIVPPVSLFRRFGVS